MKDLGSLDCDLKAGDSDEWAEGRLRPMRRTALLVSLDPLNAMGTLDALFPGRTILGVRRA